MFAFIKCLFRPHDFKWGDECWGHGVDRMRQEFVEWWRIRRCRNCGKVDPSSRKQFLRRENVYGE